MAKCGGSRNLSERFFGPVAQAVVQDDPLADSFGQKKTSLKLYLPVDRQSASKRGAYFQNRQLWIAEFGRKDSSVTLVAPSRITRARRPYSRE